MMRMPLEMIDQLITSWRANPDVESILVFGSHATGHASPDSDIDLYVLIRDGAKLEFPALCRIDGHLLETFIGTRRFFEGSFERFHNDNSRIGQSQFATAKVLFDRNGEGAGIQSSARQWLEKPRITQTVQQAYWPKRVIYSSIDRLERLYQTHLRFVTHTMHSSKACIANTRDFSASPLWMPIACSLTWATSAGASSIYSGPFPMRLSLGS